MMKNKKLMVAFILMVAFLLVMVSCVKANDIGQLPTIVTDPNGTVQTGNNETNTNTGNNVNNTPITNTNTTANNVNNTNTNGVGNNETLPQTGVQEDVTLFVFIGICIASAIYAYFRIKKYNGIN